MPISLPESAWGKFTRSTGPYDLAAAVVNAGGLLGAAGRFFISDALGWGLFMAGTAAAGLGVQGLKARALFTRLQQDQSVHDLEGCLHTLETILLGPDLEPSRRSAAGLRLTIHVPDGKGNLVQAMNYVGDQRGGGAGRSMPENVGIVGQAYRQARLEPALQVLEDHRTTENYDDFVNQMVSDYGFSPEAARQLNAATMSWLAIAIPHHDGRVEGVLYCDSKQADFFIDARREDVLHATVGIAYFVGLRYA
jgi:hypothetical protein